MSTPEADMVIVAAGTSRRMAGINKLEADVLGRPLLAWTVDSMSLAACLRRLVLVVSAEHLERLRSAPWLNRHGVELVAGGSRRSNSVRAGLAATDAEVVLVHDGARPLATPALADAVARLSASRSAAVPVVPVVDSLKQVAGGRTAGSVNRQGLARAQTPQGAQRELLLHAFAGAGNESYSDEAGLLEAHGVEVATLPGEAHNLKVTEPADLELVRAVLAQRLGRHQDRYGQAYRTGSAQDSHPFGPADGLCLGGLVIEEAPRLFGHSDGDVALHALASAMLAAAGLGDLGRLFPAGDRETAGISSTVLLARVIERLAQAGWRPAAAQLSLLGARPRLGARRLAQMQQRLAELLEITPDALSLSASSGNLSGPEGAGLVISAAASVTLVPTGGA